MKMENAHRWRLRLNDGPKWSGTHQEQDHLQRVMSHEFASSSLHRSLALFQSAKPVKLIPKSGSLSLFVPSTAHYAVLKTSVMHCTV